VKFESGDVTLAGTLSLPEGDGPHPAVVLISGSGAQNRDEDVFGFKVFRPIADHLTQKGIAVLRYDDRGIGGSSTGTADDTSETFAGDVASAVEYLKTRPDIDPEQIGLLGHSEGGLIAPLVAVQNPDVAFLVLMAPPGIRGRELLIEQARLVTQSGGATDAVAEEAAQKQADLMDAIMTGEGLEEVEAEIRTQTEEAVAQMTDEQRKALGDVDEWLNNAVEQQVAALGSPWIRFFVSYDPAPVLEKVTAPVLALFGGKDVQVAAESNAAGLEAALEAGGNADVTVQTFPEANHLFQAATTGSPNEYATLEREFVPGFLDTISDTILARVELPAQ
jgi:pimeloyl-ACP methyl ester carboxylesterase